MSQEAIIEPEHLGSPRWYWSAAGSEGIEDTENKAQLAAALASMEAKEKENCE